MYWGRFLLRRDITIHQTIYFFVQMIHLTSAGICWMSVDPKTSACGEAFNLNMTREECCNISHVPSVSWTPEEHISRSRLFYVNFLGGDKIRCQRCHSSCATVQCSDGRVCRMINGSPECICKPRCTSKMKHLGPFCGTNGRKYKSYCSLLRHNCVYQQQVDISYFGKCRKSCRNVECFHGNHCLQDQNGIPHCVSCNAKCPLDIPDNSNNYVCGSDGRTYKNTCDLKAAICQKGQSIKIAYHGPCLENARCSTLQCPNQKKCLFDVKTRTPTCSDCSRSCSVAFNIPVCGTDGRTYSSYCHMRKVSCRKGKLIRTRRAGECKGSSKNSLKRRRKGRRRTHKKTKLERKTDDIETNQTVIRQSNKPRKGKAYKGQRRNRKRDGSKRRRQRQRKRVDLTIN